MDSLFSSVLRAPRSKKRLLTLLIDTFFIVSAFWLSLIVRLDSIQPLFEIENWLLLSIVIPCSLFAFVNLGLYRAVLRYVGSHAVGAIVVGTSISTVVLVLASFFTNIDVPRTMPVIYAWLLILAVGGSRIMVRAMMGRLATVNKTPVVIYGAGSAGRQLAPAIGAGDEYYVSAFIDDDKLKQGAILQGIPVIAFDGIYSLLESNKVKKVLLAMPSESRARRKEILAQLENLPVEVMTIPGMVDVVEGRATLDEIKDVEIEDLLGRDPVEPKQNLLNANIMDKSVMVTGAGGSIGSELCRQIIKQSPSKLVLFELSEFALYSIEKELSEVIRARELNIELIPIMGSVQHINRLETCMIAFGVQTVYHAAAYKHVPLVEHNVVEGIRNNVFGTYYSAKAAINAKVETFVLVSTDKAVRPTNVMGTTKRMAELCLQGLAQDKQKGIHNTRFSMVRFGNVLGSSGSVVPLFRRQIKEGGPITLTHPDITRFFMTIPEAAQLVIQAGAMGKGGDVFVLDMGGSVKIKDLATKMVHLSGLEIKSDSNPHGDIEIQCTGLRPGEKLYEELLIGDNVQETGHERIMTAQEVMLPLAELKVFLEALDIACHNFEHEKIRELLLDAPTGFDPTDGICDLVWNAKTELEESHSNRQVNDNKVISFK
ncbi:polysaccharide biosynthesis protein [Pseudoalteromonas luteoviolacea]|uniref:Nucleoside-diphosphate sugar epimerase n=1 Tax=Pseudoalteromonas luteoviolacea S4054 TaxID=1129367 RepID=A0A0F6AF08_9GAMM|nr:nucleoside-diphosphate sugar epimerase/dehydratase [Pseudoalteromonas luteoviolacea]AOT09686.1 nucleoside-diphosphate sugar epimerase [Pseudoalteromonas luteoviolacea]AOT14599.1 nucleoside-diphosphate sugar epimerase [Pseudoalteromonas luteoviolacea]AOT19513.1 nucleoside-diphosphate sugar epimerase [Pseudoalteromonas luteoviolacea]KKE83954.1 nucleoside-diphosphate sugar epimerase [Pseudoalteromonas luteoviolacea S4054]KZN77348.1 nucleoside-diphosphate sugar epimerase [Pseudoalteromonas lute